MVDWCDDSSGLFVFITAAAAAAAAAVVFCRAT